MAEVAFDTHKAVKELCSAGFDDTQAEALVDQINGAFVGSVATKADVERLVTRDEFREAVAELATKEKVAELATKEELREAVAKLATKEELREAVAKLATKEELREEVAKLATKEELREEVAKLATKDELEKLELRMVALLQRQANTYLRYLMLMAAAIVALSKGVDLLFG